LNGCTVDASCTVDVSCTVHTSHFVRYMITRYRIIIKLLLQQSPNKDQKEIKQQAAAAANVMIRDTIHFSYVIGIYGTSTIMIPVGYNYYKNILYLLVYYLLLTNTTTYY
jgi:hypothetical protein